MPKCSSCCGLFIDDSEMNRLSMIVSNFLNIPLQDMMSRSRKVPHVVARNTVMYFAYEIKNLNKTQIGVFFKRDHSTVIHALRSVENDIFSNKVYRKKIEELRVILENDEKKQPEKNTENIFRAVAS